MPKRQVEVTRIYDRNIRSTAPLIINVGGARSSKSYSLIQLLVQKFLSESNKEILIARKTLPSLRLTAYKVFVNLLRDYGYYNKCIHNKTNLTLEYKDSTVYFMSIDDPEKVKSSEFNYVFLEEANEFTYDDFMILWMRMSAPTPEHQPNKLFLALNPSDEFSWVNTKVANWADAEVIRSTYLDNPFLSETYKKTLEDLKDIDPELYKIYALGEYATLSNIIYQNHITERVFPERFQDEMYGLDFGFNNPAALVHVGINDGELYEREIIYQSRLTNPELIDLLAERGVNKKTPIYADSAEPKSIEDIYRAGYNIHPASKQVMDGIKTVKQFKIHIHHESVNLIKEKRTYKWRQDKNKNNLDEPVKFNDHCMDAERYAIHSHGTAPDSSRFKVASSKREW